MLNSHKSETSSDSIYQKQSAAENSNQLQVGTFIVNQGITEERARIVFEEMIPQAIQEYAQDAYKTANDRISYLENAVMPRILDMDNALTSFADPAFQLLLRKAQHSAASTERVDDYSLLSELIVCQIQKGSDRKNRTGISQAIEIVGDIDSDALCALTVAHSINRLIPVSGDLREGLQALNALFDKIYYTDLPLGMDWLDHLDVLGALRISRISSLKKIIDYYAERLSGYVCVGIQIESENYRKAIDILASANLNEGILRNNDLLEGYVRLPVRDREAITELWMNSMGVHRPILTNEIEALQNVWDMYTQEQALLEKVKAEFGIVWDSFKVLKEVRIWWDEIPCAFDITKVGTVLAHTNAKRCDSNLPDLM